MDSNEWSLANLAEYKSKRRKLWIRKNGKRQFEEINGRKRSESKLTPNKRIKIYIGIALAVLVTLSW